MEPESKPLEQEQELVQDPPVSADRKDEDEEEEEEEEEDRIVEKSPNSRFHKRNKRFPKQIVGVDSAFVAIEPKSGKEVIWNECVLSDKKGEKENRYLSIIKKLKRNSHPFLARFLDAWIAKPDDGPRKLAFITERLDECSLKQFLCNSPKNNRSWKRHVGQLLSVLMFLHRLGIAHGNLTKETIYYQNSGNLRVGPFSLGGCLDQKSQSSDVYALGVVALEIAVWTPTEFPQSLSPSELCQEMLIRLENADQRSFIDTCFESNAPAGNRIKRLINHNAVTEVPVLKLLSAKVLVDAMRLVTSEDGATTEQTGFATLLKEYLSRYEDETVIVEVHFAHDKIVNSRSWKDFRSNFTLTSKFLDDVKNGFYPLFGCRWHWAPYQDEDDESCAAAGAGTTNGTGATAPSSGHFNRTDSGVIPSQAHSSGASTVPSASVSRKQSSATRTSEGTGGAPVLHEDEFEASDVHPLPPSVARSSSLCDSSQSRSSFLAHGHQSDSGVTTQPPFSKTIRSLAQDDEPSAQATASFFIGSGSAGSGIPIHPDEGERLTRSHSSSPHGRSAASSATDHPDTRVPASELTTGLVTEHPLGATLYGRTSNTTENADPLIHAQTSTIAQMGASASPSSPPTQTQYSLAADQPVAGPDRRLTGELKESGSLPALNQINQTTGLIDEIAGQELVGRSIALVGFPTEDNRVSAERLGALARYSKSADDAVDDEAEDEDKDEEDDDDDNDDEDEEDDDDDDKNVGESVERFEPQTIHVAAPDRAPAYPALFTHCQYFYIGAGRWQVYVQMWFVEDRLKREAFVQVFDDEWHDCQRVADLFEASRCVNPADRSNLVRLLSLARHNCPLIDGELQLPGPLKSRSSHFDAFELHEKLTALRLHQQAREQFVHETAVPNDSLLAENAPHSSAPTKSLDTEQLSSVPTEKDTFSTPSGVPEPDSRVFPIIPEDVPACADHIAQLQEQQRNQQQLVRGTEPDTLKSSGAAHTRTDALGSTNTMFLDVGALAPRNAYCAMCDTHDYLHHTDLPAYLISPCYHCREALAREAKISPETLLDLHLQHSIPWPAFLQARFNIPVDGRSVDELIAYDCRWRSRQPCRCTVTTGGSLLPPCVEFPWLCFPVSAVNGNIQTPSRATSADAEKDGSAAQFPSDSVSRMPDASVTAPGENRLRREPKLSSPPHGTAVSRHPSESTISMPVMPHPNIRGLLPCASRHTRGAPMTCCHGIQFPRMSGSTSSGLHPTTNTTPPTTVVDTCQVSSTSIGVATNVMLNAPQSIPNGVS